MENDNGRFCTGIGTADADSITVRGEDLIDDLIGQMDFTTFFYFHLTGERPTEAEKDMIDAILVTLVEHGITPSVIAARLTHLSAPESLQGAVASGILGAGNTYLGSMENTTAMLQRGDEVLRTTEKSVGEVASEIVAQREYIPGLGHPIHKPEDPRTERLFEIAQENGYDGRNTELFRQIHSLVQSDKTGPIPINASGAIGTIIAEMGLPPNTARGLSLVARTAGLIGHINEEREQPMGQDIWDLVDGQITYTGGN